MNSQEAIDKLGVRPETAAKADVDVLRLVMDEEFDRRMPMVRGDYRERTIKRLLKARVGFTTDANIYSTLFRKMVELNCLVCTGKMELGICTGAGGSFSHLFRCEKCNLEVSLTAPHTSLRLEFKE